MTDNERQAARNEGRVYDFGRIHLYRGKVEEKTMAREDVATYLRSLAASLEQEQDKTYALTLRLDCEEGQFLDTISTAGRERFDLNADEAGRALADVARNLGRMAVDGSTIAWINTTLMAIERKGKSNG